MGNEGQQEEDVKAVTQNSAKGEEEAPRSSEASTDRTSPPLRSWEQRRIAHGGRREIKTAFGRSEEGAPTVVTEGVVEGVVSEEDPCAVATEGAAKVITFSTTPRVPWP